MRLTLALLLALTAVATAAQQPKPSQYPSGSAVATIGELNVQLDSLDARLGKASRRLSTLFQSVGGSNAVAGALDGQSAAWVRYRGAECWLVGAATGAGGSWPSAWARVCEVDRTAERLRRVESAHACVEMLRRQDRDDEVVRCLDLLLVQGDLSPAGKL